MLVFSNMISRQIQPLERGFLILIMSSYKFLGEIEISSYSHDKSPFSWSNPHEFLPYFQTDWLLFPPSGDVAFFDHLQKRDGGIFIGHIAEHLLRTWLHSHLVLWSHDDVWPVVYKRNTRHELVNGKNMSRESS